VRIGPVAASVAALFVGVSVLSSIPAHAGATRLHTGYSVVDKKVCKNVKKKVHGKVKKVKVCSNVAAPKKTSTPTPTLTSTPTNTPTATATSTLTPTSTLTSGTAVGSRFQQCQTTQGSITVDSVQGVSVQADAFQLNNSSNLGALNYPAGYVWLFVRGTEALTDPTSIRPSYYSTGGWNFRLVDSSGNAYKSNVAVYPPNAPERSMQEQVLSALQPVNSGWVGFVVPNQPAMYRLEWTSQDFHTPNWISMGADLQVESGSLTRLSSLPQCALPFPDVPAAQSAVLTVHAWVVPRAMFHDSYPLLYVKTDGGATCSPSISYSPSASQTLFDGSPHTASATGIVTWTWHELNVGTIGVATVICHSGSQTASTTASFTVYN
jgi:hypothetical protein